MPNAAPTFLKRHLSGTTGMLLCALAAYVLAALFSHHAGDPSFNNAGSGHVRNLAGTPGAYISDLLLQSTGLGAVILAATLSAWGSQLITRRRVTFWWLRVLALLLTVTAISAFMAAFPAPGAWECTESLGGFMGMFFRRTFAGLLGVPVYALVFAGLALLTLPVALGLTRRQWRTLYRRIAAILHLGGRSLDYFRGAFVDDAPEHIVPVSTVRQRAARKAREEREKPEKPARPRKAESDSKPVVMKTPARAPVQTSMTLSSGKGFQLPPLTLLTPAPARQKKAQMNETALSQNAKMLETVLEEFGVNGKITAIRPGPVVTLYELEPAPGTKSSRVIGLADDIARSMSAIAARIAVIPGRNALGIELPNATRETVYLREMCEAPEFKNADSKLALALGKNIGGDPIIVDLAKMPHVLVAGTTGSGKSVAINTMILSLVYRMSPEQCKFIMIDPKMLELSVYDGIPHLLAPVVTEPGKAVVALKWTVKEMENRYRLMSTMGVRNISGYNERLDEARSRGETLSRTVQTGFDPDSGKPVIEHIPLDMNPLPFIVVIVDEMADLMLVAGKDIESSIQRLAQMARAAGIHIIMATQRPSVDVITGVIKANFPTRISFQVTSRIDSRTILGEQGAEQLLGQGDMLYMAGGGRISRVHGPFVSDREVEEIVKHLKSQGEPRYVEDVTREDEAEPDSGGEDGEEGDLYAQAVGIVTRDGKASTSYLQRRLKIGYNRAADLIDRMEREGVISAPNHAGKREVLEHAG